MTNPADAFSQRLRHAMDGANASPEWISAQLQVRGVRVSTDTVRRWLDGVVVPTPASDRRALAALEAVLPGTHLQLDAEDLAGADSGWHPLIALPPGHPARARMLQVRQVVERRFVVEVCHDSTVVLDDPCVMERTIHLLARPVSARRSDPGVFLLFPTGAALEVLDATGRERLGDPVALGDGWDLVHLSRRRTSTVKPGHLITVDYRVRITTPQPVQAIRVALPEMVELFTVDVTLPNVPEVAMVLHRSVSDGTCHRTALEPLTHLQYSTAGAPVGIHHLMWGAPPA